MRSSSPGIDWGAHRSRRWRVAKVPNSEFELGRVDALVEDGDVTLALGERGASVLRSGVLVAQDDRETAFLSAFKTAALDGMGSWLLAVASSGAVYRLRGGARLEPVSARYGLTPHPIRHAAGFETGVAFAYEDALAYVHGGKATTFVTKSLSLLAVGPSRVALSEGTMVRTIDLLHPGEDRSYSVRGATALVYGATGRLQLATNRALYEDDGLDRLSCDTLQRASSRAWFRRVREPIFSTIRG